MNTGPDSGRAVLVPGARDVRATLDTTDESADTDTAAGPGDPDPDTEAVVVACPPHPQHGGSRSDSRLTAVSAALGEREIDCLRFDYGPWDRGRGECRDVRAACRWAIGRYDSVGLFGYSFGATMALLAAGEASAEGAPEIPTVVSVLAPDRSDFGADRDAPNPDRDAVGALDSIRCPTQILHGERDTTVEWEPVVERARERGFAVESLPADHFFVGQTGKVAKLVASFLATALR